MARDLEEQTDLGDVYLAGLMRAQRRLSIIVVSLILVGLVGLPILLSAVPSTRTLTIAGIPFPWLAVGGAVYPSAWFLARWYTRQCERLEADFTAVVESS